MELSVVCAESSSVRLPSGVTNWEEKAKEWSYTSSDWRNWVVQSLRDREVGGQETESEDKQWDTHIATHRRTAGPQFKLLVLLFGRSLAPRDQDLGRSERPHTFSALELKRRKGGLCFKKETGFLPRGHLNRPDCGYAIILFMDSAAGGWREWKGDTFAWLIYLSKQNSC